MRRFSGSTVAVNVVTPRADATCARWAIRTVASPRPCISSATANATSARSGPLELEDRVGDDALLGAGGDDQPVALGPVALRRHRGGLVEVDAEREEPQPARVVATGRRGTCAARASSAGETGPDARGGAVAQRDVDIGGDGRAHAAPSRPTRRSRSGATKSTPRALTRPPPGSARRRSAPGRWRGGRSRPRRPHRRAGGVVVQPARVQRDRDDRRRADPPDRALVERDQLASAAGSASRGSRR